MNELFKANAAKILACYNNTDDIFEKGKGFLIGQKDKSGKNVKTAEGWKPVKTHGHLVKEHSEEHKEVKDLKTSKKYKREKYVEVEPKEGDVYHDYDNMQAGHYNSRKITKLYEDGTGDVAIVDIWPGRVNIMRELGRQNLSRAKKHINQSRKENHEKEEDIKELAHNISMKLNLDKIKGGDLNNSSVINELKKSIEKLKEIGENYNVESNSVPAGGFSGANSGTMTSSRSGKAISIDTNSVHHGGYYAGTTPFLIQIKVGGALDIKVRKAFLRVSAKLLSKFTLKHNQSDYSSTTVRDTDGTNWSSMMLTAPQSNKSYTTVPKLKELE